MGHFFKNCSRLSRNTKNLTLPESVRTVEATADREGERKPPTEIRQFNFRNQFLQQRALYFQVLQHYELLKKSGKLVDNWPTLQAIKKMNKAGISYNFHKLQDVPDVYVGYEFEFKTEMFVVGLHHQEQGGIA